jgi:hypothetical protein
VKKNTPRQRIALVAVLLWAACVVAAAATSVISASDARDAQSSIHVWYERLRTACGAFDSYAQCPRYLTIREGLDNATRWYGGASERTRISGISAAALLLVPMALIAAWRWIRTGRFRP